MTSSDAGGLTRRLRGGRGAVAADCGRDGGRPRMRVTGVRMVARPTDGARAMRQPSPTSRAGGRALLRILLPAALLVLGAGALSWIAADAMVRMRESLYRAQVPGESTWALREPGPYTLYVERPKDEPDDVRAAAARLIIEVRSADTGAAVPVDRAGGSQRYTIGDCAGSAIGGFEAPAAGDYVLSARYPADQPGPELTLTAAVWLLRRLMYRIFVGQGVMATAVVGAAVAFVALRGRE